jgi:hypothetical protein
MRILFMLGLLSAVLVCPAVGQQILSDAFDSYDRGRWITASSAAAGSSVSVSQGKLHVTMAAGTDGKRGISALLGSFVSGDFEIRVDYSLATWPSSHSSRVCIGAGDPRSGASVGCLQNKSKRALYAHFGTRLLSTLTSVASGSLRMVRKGSTYYGYWGGTSGWVLIGSAASGPVSTVWVTLTVHTEFKSPANVTATFDNFSLTAAKIAPTLTGSGVPRPGSTVGLELDAFFEANHWYQLATSFGTGPITLPIYNATLELGLSPDALFWLSAGGSLPSVFLNYSGLLSKQGTATAGIKLPGEPGLIGLRIRTAYLTHWAGRITRVSNTYAFTIVK